MGILDRRLLGLAGVQGVEATITGHEADNLVGAVIPGAHGCASVLCVDLCHSCVELLIVFDKSVV